MILESTGLVKALPHVTASHPTPVVFGDDGLNRHEASTSAQLRTNHKALRGFHFAIQQSDGGTCACGEESKSVRYFFFQCRRCDQLRSDMIQAMGDRFADLEFALGGRWGQVGTDGKPVEVYLSRCKPNLKWYGQC
jgi:hypothetical protein